ncbi:MAG: Fe-S cluster assembly protein SufD [Dehalococcoidia bacterium]
MEHTFVTQQATHTDRYVAAFKAFEHNGAGADPVWLRELRRNAMSNFEERGFPTARRGNEHWKYTDVRPIAEAALAPLPPETRPGEGIDLAPYELPCPRVHQVVFVDGRYAPPLSTEPRSAAGMHLDVISRKGDGPVVGRLADAITYGLPLAHEHLGQYASHADNAFTALNTAFTGDGAFVHIPDGVTVVEPIYLLFISTGASGPRVTHPRVLIVAGKDSSATVLQSYEASGADGAHFNNAVTEVVTNPGASLRLYKLQREAASAFHVATTEVALARDSRLASATVDLGGGLVRHDINVRLAGPGASVSLHGLYLGRGQSHTDNHTFIDHMVPDTSSEETYKGIMDDSSHAVFVGHVLVRPDAQRITSHQVNKNLLLSKEAEVDTQPKLEIFADDVTCTHGAAVGQLDEDAMFYLKSRGIGADVARGLLVHGFVNEIIEGIADDAVRQYIDEAVMERLRQQPAVTI